MRALLHGCLITLLALTLVTATTAADKKKPVESADKNLVIGDGYTLRVVRHDVQQMVQGELVKVNAQWIVLRQIRNIPKSVATVPGLASVPVVGGAFRKTTYRQTDDFLWIPREAVSVERHYPATTATETYAPTSELPPVQTACSVELAYGDKVVKHSGGVEKASNEQLVVSVGYEVATTEKNKRTFKYSETRYKREEISRADILWVRVANFETAAQRAKAP